MRSRDDLVEVILAVLESGDPEPITGLLTPSAVVWHNSDDVATPAATAFQQVRGLHALVDDLSVEVTRREPTSDGAVVQYVIRGVVRSSGSALAARNCIFVRFEDDRIARIDEYVDPSFEAQLGVAQNRGRIA